MGIVAYYVHVDTEQLQMLREEPAAVWHIESDPRFAKAARIDIDRDWQVVSWLASSKKRKEQQQSAAMMNVINRDESNELLHDDVKYEKALAEERKRLGIEAENTDVLPTDQILAAIEGRGTKEQREAKLDYGLGGARVFSQNEVKLIAVTFSNFKEQELRKNFDRKTMHRFDVGGMSWMDEKETVLDEYLIPSFRQLSSFYQQAARLHHHVLVIYQ